MKEKLNPAPWDYDEFLKDKYAISHETFPNTEGQTGCGIVTYTKSTFAYIHTSNKAVVELMTAAPELLEACEKALSIADSWVHDQYDGTGLLKEALAELEPIEAIIKKAKGL